MIPQVDSAGRIYAASAVPVTWNNGVGYAANGVMCTTTSVSGTDSYVDGWRLSATGQVVVAAQSGSLFFNNGLPFNAADGSMARQVDVVPGANDPYASGGIRVGPSGGVYMSTAIPP